MKKIIYYITDHGHGHATRSIAIIRLLQKLNTEVFVRNSNLEVFLNKSLPKTKIISGITDVGPSLNNNGISINETKTKKLVGNWITNLEKFSKKEKDVISKINPNLIISDISAMPFLAAKKMKKSSIAISNFSWYDALNFLAKHERDLLKSTYDNADLTIKLPFGTKMAHFKRKRKVGIVSRIPKKTKKELKKFFGIQESQFTVLFALGGSRKKITCKADKNVKFLSINSSISNQPIVNVSDWIEGQELVSMADLVICKCGYGLVTECLTNGTPFFYVYDKNHLEQKGISTELKKYGLKNDITFEELNQINFSREFFKSITKFKKEPYDNERVANYIFEYIRK